MRDFILYNIEVLLCLMVFYVLYYFGLRKETNHQFVRAYLIMAIGISFIAPFIPSYSFSEKLDAYVPAMQLPEFLITSVDSSATENSSSTSNFPWLIFYGMTCVIFLMFFVKELRKIWHIKRSKNLTVKGYKYQGCTVLIHQSEFPTFSFMHTIYLSTADLEPEAAKEKILKHELAHVKGAHSIDVIFMELIRILFWFNPMVYLFKSALTLSHEYIADKKSVTDEDHQKYVNLLVNQTLSNLGLSLGSHFGRKSGILSRWPLTINKSQTLKRIKMIKNKRKMSPLKYLIPAFAIALSIGVVSCVEDEALQGDTIVEGAASIGADDQFVEIELLDDQTFQVAEEMPVFPGGEHAMYKYIGKNLDYPESARENGIEGRVLVQFKINKDGSITDAKSLQSPNNDLSEEAERVIKTMPKWKPGKVKGEDVKVNLIIPILFKIDDSGTKIEEMSTQLKNVSQEEIVVVTGYPTETSN